MLEASTRGRTQVRLAQATDNVEILRTLLQALEDGPTFYPAPELPYALQYLLDLIAQGLVHVATRPDGRICGVVALDWAHWPWARQHRYLYNQHLWVEPLSRSGGTAIRLLELAKETARQRQVPLLLETSMLDVDTGKKERFIEKNGFQRIGAKFFFSPNQSM